MSDKNSSTLINDSILNGTNYFTKTEDMTVYKILISSKEANVSGEILLMMLLLSLSLGGGHFLKRLKLKFINESLFATIIGLIAGAILSFTENEKYINNITTAYVKFFLIVLLPPIIFESAYNMRRKEFFKNVGTILIYAVLGTLISITFTGISLWAISQTGIFHTFSIRESFLFSSLISSTDTVSILSAFKDYSIDPNFFQLVYGESILNDAVSIVFYDTCMNSYFTAKSMTESVLYGILSFVMNFIGSTVLGIVIGFLTAVFLKGISGRVRNIEKIEISLMVVLPWVSYLSAQMLGLSGIVSILFNGVAHASYTKPNLTDWSKITVKTSYEGVSSIFETLVFIFLGIGFFSFHNSYNNISFPLVFIILIIIILARFLNVYICSKIANFSRTDNLIDHKKQFFLLFSGVRGAMAFALSIKSLKDLPQAGPIFLALTLIIISFTLLYSSFFIDCVLRKCEIINICEADNFEESGFRHKSCFESFKSKIEIFNSRYLMPCVLRDNKEEFMRNSSVQFQLRDVKAELPVEDNKVKIKEIREESPKHEVNSNNYFERRKSEDVSIDKKNFQIKNMHLFE